MVTLTQIKQGMYELRMGSDENDRAFCEFVMDPIDIDDDSGCVCCICGKVIQDGWICDNKFYCYKEVEIKEEFLDYEV